MKQLSDRIAALETRHLATGKMLEVRFMPTGLSSARQEAWRAREVVPLERAGQRVLVVEFVRPAA